MKGLNFEFITHLKPYRNDIKPVEVRSHAVPQRFEIEILFKDQKPRSLKLFSVWLDIEFSKDEIARALEIRTRGFTHQKVKGSAKPLNSPESVQRWQLEAVEKNLTEIVALAVSLSVQNLDYSGVIAPIKSWIPENSYPHPVWDNEEIVSRSWFRNFKNSELEDFADSWEVDPIEISKVKNFVVETSRQTYSNPLLKKVAKIYKDEEQRAKNDLTSRRARPIEEIVSELQVSNRTAERLVKRARENGFLDPISKPKNSARETKRGK